MEHWVNDGISFYMCMGISKYASSAHYMSVTFCFMDALAC